MIHIFELSDILIPETQPPLTIFMTLAKHFSGAVSPKRGIAGVTIQSTSECDFIWNQGDCRCNW